MIKTLHISNYALISGIDIAFAPGFNIITGETGAGKSIMLGALSLLLGERADARVVRDSTRKSVIEAVFDISDADGIEELLAENRLDSQAGECILRREIAPGGRSRAFINDTPVNLTVLREVAVHLVDIHSQHQNLLLASPEYQMAIIDNLAGTKLLLEDYRKAFAAYRVALKQYTDTRELIRRNRDDADFLRFQYEQLDELDLQPGEHEALEQEREQLANVNEIKETLGKAIDPLINDEDNALTLMRQAIDALEELSATIGKATDGTDFHALAERLESARIEVADISDSLADYDMSLGADPERLEEIEERLSRLYSLELKHHAENADGLIEIRDRLAAQLEALDDADNVLATLEIAAKKAKKIAISLAAKISEMRASAAAEFADILRRTASPLGMDNLRCEISLTRIKLGLDGYEPDTDACRHCGFGWRDFATDACNKGYCSRAHALALNNIRRSGYGSVGRHCHTHGCYDVGYWPLDTGNYDNASAGRGSRRLYPFQGVQGRRGRCHHHAYPRSRRGRTGRRACAHDKRQSDGRGSPCQCPCFNQ